MQEGIDSRGLTSSDWTGRGRLQLSRQRLTLAEYFLSWEGLASRGADLQ